MVGIWSRGTLVPNASLASSAILACTSWPSTSAVGSAAATTHRQASSRQGASQHGDLQQARIQAPHGLGALWEHWLLPDLPSAYPSACASASTSP